MPAWFDHAFGPWYVKLYSHRDRAEAARTLRTLDPWIPPEGIVLDVACGTGRHLEVLLEGGRRAFGIDRSCDLLGAAPPGLRGRLLRGDMRRLPVGDRTAAAVLCLFTSFGYFGSRAAHAGVLREFARAAVPGGCLALDTANPPRLRQELVPVSERRVEGHRVRERRSITRVGEDERVVKEITVEAPGGGELARFREEVSLYDRDSLLDLLAESGWRTERVFGDYDGGPWSESAPRLLVAARRIEA